MNKRVTEGMCRSSEGLPPAGQMLLSEEDAAMCVNAVAAAQYHYRQAGNALTPVLTFLQVLSGDQVGQNRTGEWSDEFIKITEAAMLIDMNKGVVSRWADEGKVQDNGKKGRGRRVSLISVLLYAAQRKREQLKRGAVELGRDAAALPDRH